MLFKSFNDVAMKGFILRPAARQMSVTLAIKDKFETAWQEKQKLQKVVKKEPKNKDKYGDGFYGANIQRLKKGYEHPYHSERNPLIQTSILNYYKILNMAAGPEQVSPHYETLSRSRRGLLFLFAYFGTIQMISSLGGVNHNEWFQGLVFHHKFLISFIVGYAEVKHFAMLPGPKFTIFYDVFSHYEANQLLNQW